MIDRYMTSTESYKGFTLEVWHYTLGNNRWHRECLVWCAGNRVAICKSKKEAKEIIDSGASVIW